MANNNNLESLQNNPYINNIDPNANANQGLNQNQGANQNGLQNQGGLQQNTNNAQNTPNTISSFFSSNSSQQDFLKGALIGAVATFILTNKDAQKAIFKGFAKISSLFEMGIEELKERYEDAKAEVDSK